MTTTTDNAMMDGDVLEQVAEIVSAYVSHNSVSPSDLPALIANTHCALRSLSGAPGVELAEELKPAVPIRKSVTPDFIICLDDGKQFKLMKRHLAGLGMTPGEYKYGGENLSINYSFAESPFGNILVASTPKGICHMAFADNQDEALQILKDKFPNAVYSQMVDLMQQNVLYIFTHDWTKLGQIKLHLKGTEFQLKVWETLLKIPMGQLTTYGNIARQILVPKASRAVGTAIGDNPVAFLIPCHRIIQSTGVFGGYHWGTIRKTAIIGWEAAHVNQ